MTALNVINRYASRYSRFNSGGWALGNLFKEAEWAPKIIPDPAANLALPPSV
jgi:hypothetical protein